MSMAVYRLVVMAASVLFAVPAGSSDWVPYHNARFGFSLDYPAGKFKPEAPPDNGAGQVFTTADGAEILGQATFNTALKPDSFRKGFHESGTVESEETGDGWFIVTRVANGKVLYDKVIFSCGIELLNHLSISYPTDKRETYDPIAKQVGDSFLPGRGEDMPVGCE
jgi:hypothetical protein